MTGGPEIRSLLWASLAAWTVSTTAHGRACADIDFQEQLQLDGHALVLNGLGLRKATLFKVKVYVAALYLPRASTDAPAILAASAPYEMQLHFVRSVGAADIAKAWTEGFERNAQSQLPAGDQRVGILRSWMTDIKSGQEMKFMFRPGNGLQGSVNGTAKGTIYGDDFGRAFLANWLGVPPNPEIKAGLLGGNCD